MSRSLDYDRVATILAEATYMDDETVAKRWDVSTRTVQRYRARMEIDDKLSHIVAKKLEQVATEWANEIPKVLRAQLGFLKRAADEANPKNPKAIHAIAGAYKLVFESGIMKAIVDARLADAGTNRQIPAEN